MKSKVFLAISVILCGVVFYFLFTEGLLFVYQYLGLYNMTTFGFILGEVVVVALLLAFVFLWPILYGRKLYRRANPRKGRSGTARTIAVICAMAAAGIVVTIHFGFFQVIRNFLIYCGIEGTAVSLGVLIFEIVCGLAIFLPSAILGKRFILLREAESSKA